MADSEKSSVVVGPSISELASQVGTPLYLLDLDDLANRVATFRSLATEGLHDAECIYSLKTNYLPAVLETVRAGGMGVDVVSGYELELALRQGFAPASIVFNGPVKRAAELRRAVELGIRVNIDSITELRSIEAIAAASSVRAKVGLRLTSAIDPYTGATRTTQTKFGIPVEDPLAGRLLRSVLDADALSFQGFEAHLGSQLVGASTHFAALEPILSWVASSSQRGSSLNLGGGFPVPGISRRTTGLDPSRPGTAKANDFEFSEPDLKTWFSELHARLSKWGLSDLSVVVEPGRWIISEPMSLITNVVAIRDQAGGRVVVIDGGVNLLSTAGPGELHRFWTAHDAGVRMQDCLLVGPLCYEGDVWARDVKLPANLREGDQVVVKDAGAYSITRASSFNQLRAPVVAVTNGAWRVVWRRETLDDLLVFAEGTELLG